MQNQWALVRARPRVKLRAAQETWERRALVSRDMLRWTAVSLPACLGSRLVEKVWQGMLQLAAVLLSRKLGVNVAG